MDSEKRKEVSRRTLEMRRSKTLIRRLMLEMRARLDDALRSQNVTTSQLRFLKEVKQRPGSSGAQMARACFITPQSAQAMMARAVERGWVARGKDAENDRLVTARLTPEGERLLAYAEGVLAELESEVWAGITEADLRVMNAVLERGLKNLGE